MYCGSGCGAPPNGCSDPNAFICNVKYFFSHLGTPGNISGVFGALLYNPPNAFDKCCMCDCNRDGVVEINELITALNVAAEDLPIGSCQALFYRNDVGDFFTISNLVRGIDDALSGCQQ
jgi:hypothetical protein